MEHRYGRHAAAAAVAAVAALAQLAASGASPARAAAPAAPAEVTVATPPVAWETGDVRRSDDPAHAWVTGRYRCTSATSATTMWVSARQSPGVGSAKLKDAALAVYDGRLTDLERDAAFAAVCDGRWRPGRIPVAQQVGTLGAGEALVQWCLHDTTEKPVNSPGYALLCTVDSARVR